MPMTLEQLEREFRDHRHLGTDVPKVRNSDVEGSGSAHGTVYLAAGSTTNNGTAAVVAFDTELFTTEGITWSGSGRFTCTIPGKYLVTGTLIWTSVVTKRFAALLYKNGGPSAQAWVYAGEDGQFLTTTVSQVVSLAGGDYVEIWADHNDGSNGDSINGSATGSFMSIAKV